MKQKITVALVGNPNSGKTTLFNALTGDNQHVGNYPGVTVEKKEGKLTVDNYEINVVDLPGTYSLTAHTIDEKIARNFIINEKPDVVVDVIDYPNLERNLYLTTQLIELGVPLILAFNMSDVAKAQGSDYDLTRLSAKLGALIVKTVGHKDKGIKDVISAILHVVKGDVNLSKPNINYGKDIEKEVGKIQELIITEGLISKKAQNRYRSSLSVSHYNLSASDSVDQPEQPLSKSVIHRGAIATSPDFQDVTAEPNVFPENYNPRWLAVKLLEDDPEVLDAIDSDKIHAQIEKSSTHLKSVFGEAPEIAITERRYGFISGVCKRTVISTMEARLTMSDKVDLVLTNHLLGLPIFLALMYLMFHLTFTLGGSPMEWIEAFFGWLGGFVSGWWHTGSESPIRSLLVDGIIGGVGGVVIFLPNIMLLFMGISLLEDSGYMPRAAFIMDRLMQKLGLQGKSFIPMLIGFGCSVPAIMATRTIENRRDRLVTMLVVPLMSCGARFPIYALIIPAFFPEKVHGSMLFLMYIIGILLAIGSAKLLRITVLKGPTFPLIMELPPYRLPTLKAILMHMWEKSWLYLKKAGTVILGISIILWALTSYPKKAELTAVTPEAAQAEELAYSIVGRVGHAIEPVIKPMGFDWRIGTAMIGAFAAKEVFVAQMGIIYSVGEADEESGALRAKLQRNYTPLVGFSLMLFMLISAPCMATIAVTKQESGRWRWALFQLGALTLMAYLISVVVYQVGSLFGFGGLV